MNKRWEFQGLSSKNGNKCVTTSVNYSWTGPGWLLKCLVAVKCSAENKQTKWRRSWVTWSCQWGDGEEIKRSGLLIADSTSCWWKLFCRLLVLDWMLWYRLPGNCVELLLLLVRGSCCKSWKLDSKTSPQLWSVTPVCSHVWIFIHRIKERCVPGHQSIDYLFTRSVPLCSMSVNNLLSTLFTRPDGDVCLDWIFPCLEEAWIVLFNMSHSTI